MPWLGGQVVILILNHNFRCGRKFEKNWGLRSLGTKTWRKYPVWFPVIMPERIPVQGLECCIWFIWFWISPYLVWVSDLKVIRRKQLTEQIYQGLSLQAAKCQGVWVPLHTLGEKEPHWLVPKLAALRKIKQWHPGLVRGQKRRLLKLV